MKLQIRLALASLCMVALFLATFALTWGVAGGRQLLRPPRNGLARHLARESSRVYREGGADALETVLRYNLHPAQATVLYDFNGSRRFALGPGLADDPESFQTTIQTGYSEKMGLSGLEVWSRVDSTEGAVAVLRQVLLPRNHDDQRWQYLSTVLTSALAAASVTILAGLLVSRAIASPVSNLVLATQALSRSDFNHRIPVQAGGELRELAKSFNRMADHLEDTVLRLTEAKDKAEQSEASRRQFMADVSHNLRTPLAAMLGWTEALLDGLAPGEEQLHLRHIREQTMFVAQNVQRLTDWARWEGRALELNLAEFAVSEPLMECLQTLEEAAQRKSIQLKLVGLQSEPQVRADRLRLRELFQLLLENAVHHNEPGCNLKVEFAPQEGRLQVTVSDTGPGLPHELHNGLECRVGGGLGLAIACRLARAHGSELQLLPGPGTRLRFTLENRC